MRRTIVLLATMALTLLVASGVALAVTKFGTNGPDTLQGTNKADNLLGKGGNDVLYALGGRDTLVGGGARIGFLAAIKRDPWEAPRPCSEAPATMECSAVEDPMTWSAVRATTASVATLAPTV
jgi:Ca2+-binding RTX toxin-like protein